MHRIMCSLALTPVALVIDPRRAKLEEEIANLPEDRKAQKRADLQKRETDFLRLRRTRLGPHDFNTLKVIGRGAFGEVRRVTLRMG